MPELRFPEFKNAGEWKEIKLGEVTKINTGNSNREDSQETGGKYVFFDRSEDIRTSNKYIFNGEAIIVGGEGQKFIPKYFIGKFDLHQRAYAIMNFDNKLLGKYLFYYIYFNKKYFKQYAVGSTVKSLRLPIFQKMPIKFPSQSEQQKIAGLLSSLDEHIEAESEILESLKQHKKGLLQKLFPQEGKKIPELRFPEFENEGEWEEKKLGELVTKVLKKNKNEIIKTVFTNSATDGIIEQRDFFDKDIANKSNLENYYIVRQGDYVYNPRISKYAPVGPLFKNKTNKTGVMSPLYTIFRFKNEDNDFYQYYFKSNHWFSSIKRVSNRGARFDRISITSSDFMKIPILSPLIKEQKKIADTLSSLDELIEAQAEKIEKLKQHKKGLMQKVFPKM